MTSGAWDSQRLIFQRLVRDIRKEKGFTQSELAKLLDKPQSYVSKYESGERRLDVIELRAVCRVCGLALEEFGQRLEVEIRK